MCGYWSCVSSYNCYMSNSFCEVLFEKRIKVSNETTGLDFNDYI